jgi:hypothetical protein
MQQRYELWIAPPLAMLMTKFCSKGAAVDRQLPCPSLSNEIAVMLASRTLICP